MREDEGRSTRPPLYRFSTHSLRRVQLDASKHDPVTQQVSSQHMFFTEQGVRLYPVTLRYAWPAELDLMARLAGLRLRHRWEDWEGGTFSAGSGMHVSVYEHGQSQ